MRKTANNSGHTAALRSIQIRQKGTSRDHKKLGETAGLVVLKR